ncbi:hypothetical protein GCM10025867_27060 [Frondihabitans sucicola]|uniref:Cytochrome oxidase subunit I profile domain-containing protein n=1 Tax=Frondihabitans sucicola TaxID=1268041 RepID=A0ABN6Y3B9_9MICO|nr:hypothetical protein GCM10025867_27060 [Frondihabitans sucicola]
MSSATATRPATGGQSSGQNFNTTRVGRKGNTVVRWVTSTDHKVLGYMYLITSFIYFLVAGVMALVIRAQLFEPGLSVVATKEQYNQLFTMHGTIMLLLFATPLFSGFANAIMPLQIGAPDVAFLASTVSRSGCTFSEPSSSSPASSPRRVPRPSAGSPTRRSRIRRSHPGWAVIFGSSASR